jgi:hypothetical protein
MLLNPDLDDNDIYMVLSEGWLVRRKVRIRRWHTVADRGSYENGCFVSRSIETE